MCPVDATPRPASVPGGGETLHSDLLWRRWPTAMAYAQGYPWSERLPADRQEFVSQELWLAMQFMGTLSQRCLASSTGRCILRRERAELARAGGTPIHGMLYHLQFTRPPGHIYFHQRIYAEAEHTGLCALARRQ